jgi:ribosomal protein S18 acetylase RimI-like enzyme
LNTAAEGFFQFMLGANYVEILANAFMQPNHDLSYENVSFAEINAKVVGMFSGFSALERQSYSNNALQQAAGAWNLRFWIVSILFAPLIRIIDTVDEGDFYLQAIAVDANVRGQGVGSKLLDLAETTAIEKGAKRITLDVSANNTNAFQLYERRGYTVESSWPRYFRIPALVFSRMTKSLAGQSET